MTSGGRARTVFLGALALGVALLALGVILWRSEPGGFGWFSYGPPPSEETLSSLVLVSGRRYAALGVFAAGLVILGGAAGFALGRRSPDPHSA